ncbi:hypothetical protein [Desulfobaculum bizertense]|uniref:Uncharacterized protein n=1 Tax=Desulfobaculum bizertense DSM 18034 TaxID=1121442 RepID=A0A1T4X0R2_9BACT|nr:hypothetical protein [Desulfobaculum bizertense]UIJ37195.1 hypothetical protein LWC08_10680 [Desulfobaculum bizertense]SKA83156.1 hypothetical protein SAMN02745702_02865 [Desulfobaculum bizertense DSM 18034]
MKLNSVGVFRRLGALYDLMQKEYDQTVEGTGFTCADCPQNCCTSYFQHHTYVEWAYLWKGMKSLPEAKQKLYLERAQAYVAQMQEQLAAGERPDAMCPLNDDGLCGLYTHRLMICRLHGVVHTLAVRGKMGVPVEETFPGCWRFGEATEGRTDLRPLDRTPLYSKLAALEMEFLGKRIQTLPRVNLTLAEMLVQGAPKLR